MLQEEKIYCVLLYSLAQNFIMSKRRVAKHAATYLSPVDVGEFCTGILEAGTRLASLLTVEYPSALVRCDKDCGGLQPEGEMGDVLG